MDCGGRVINQAGGKAQIGTGGIHPTPEAPRMPASDNYKSDYEALFAHSEAALRDPKTAPTARYFASSGRTLSGAGACHAVWREYPRAVEFFEAAALSELLEFRGAREESRAWAALPADQRERRQEHLAYQLHYLAEAVLRAFPDPTASDAAREVQPWLVWLRDHQWAAYNREADQLKAGKWHFMTFGGAEQAVIDGMAIPAVAYGSPELDAAAREGVNWLLEHCHGRASEEAMMGRNTNAAYSNLRAFQAAWEGDGAQAARWLAERCKGWAPFSGRSFERKCHPDMLSLYMALARLAGGTLPYGGEKIPAGFNVDEYWGRAPVSPEPPPKKKPKSPSARPAGGKSKAKARPDEATERARRKDAILLALDLARSETARTRSQAAYDLGKLEPGAPPDLAERMKAERQRLLTDPSAEVVASAIGGIGHLAGGGDPGEASAAADALVRLLDNPKVAVVQIAGRPREFLRGCPPDRRPVLADALVRRLGDPAYYATQHLKSLMETLAEGAPPEFTAHARRRLIEASQSRVDATRNGAMSMLHHGPYSRPVAGEQFPWQETVYQALHGNPLQRKDALALLVKEAPSRGAAEQLQLADAILESMPVVMGDENAWNHFSVIMDATVPWFPEQRARQVVAMALGAGRGTAPGARHAVTYWLKQVAAKIPDHQRSAVGDFLLESAQEPNQVGSALDALVAMRPFLSAADLLRVDARLAARR